MNRSIPILSLLVGCKLFVDPSIDETCEDLDACDGGDDGGGQTGSTHGDSDADGYTPAEGDCDDNHPNLNPGATEVCDELGVDEDCNSLADDADPEVTGTLPVFEDLDADGWGGAQVGEACLAGEGETTQGGDCDDSDDATNPDATEICGNGKDDNCDGSPGECRPYEGQISPQNSQDAQFETDGFDLYGFWGASGDLDGDGNDDLVACSPFLDGTSGGAYVFADVAPGQVRRPDSAFAQVMGRGTTYLGSGAAVGDLDGDRQEDLVLQGLDGQTRIWRGPLEGELVPSDAWAGIEGIGDTSLENHGLLVADLNGDGNDDVVLSEIDAEHADGSGAVYIFDGPLASTVYGSDTATRVLTGMDDQTPGFDVIHGDFDGDGLRDLVTSDARANTTAEDAGRVWVVRDGLSPGQTSIIDVDDMLTGRRPEGMLGFGFAVGDLNGDGRDDLAVSAPGQGTSFEGQVFVFSGAPTGSRIPADAQTTITANNPEGRFGYRLVATDMSGDGQVDLVIGEPTSWGETGAIHLQYGPLQSGSIEAPDLDAFAVGPDTSRFYGYGLHAAGDLDGDGTGDVTIIGDGHMEVLFGGGW